MAEFDEEETAARGRIIAKRPARGSNTDLAKEARQRERLQLFPVLPIGTTLPLSTRDAIGLSRLTKPRLPVHGTIDDDERSAHWEATKSAVEKMFGREVVNALRAWLDDQERWLDTASGERAGEYWVRRELLDVFAAAAHEHPQLWEHTGHVLAAGQRMQAALDPISCKTLELSRQSVASPLDRRVPLKELRHLAIAALRMAHARRKTRRFDGDGNAQALIRILMQAHWKLPWSTNVAPDVRMGFVFHLPNHAHRLPENDAELHRIVEVYAEPRGRKKGQKELERAKSKWLRIAQFFNIQGLTPRMLRDADGEVREQAQLNPGVAQFMERWRARRAEASGARAKRRKAEPKPTAK